MLSLFVYCILCLVNQARAASVTHDVAFIPSPSGTGSGSWSDAYSKARILVAQMTLAEMNNMTYGHYTTANGCSGLSGAVPRLGFPGLCLQDAENGVRAVEGVNAYASGVHIGASWNRSLTYQRGLYMGREFKAKGANVINGPVVGPLGRVATGGRNWEGFAADPYLTGALAVETINGLQQSVVAAVKHYVAYEQETNRSPANSSLINAATGGTAPSVSANVDDATMHEVYLWPFHEAVEAGVGSVMTSYNRINQSYASANDDAINGILKGELDFQGFVLSDWGGQHAADSVYAGLDMAMPNSTFWDNGQLATAVSNGTLDRARLEDMATRILAAWFKVGADNATFPALGVGIPFSLFEPHEYVDAKDVASRPNIFQQAVEGHVLVKNTNKTLPLRKPQVLSVFGYDATVANSYNPSNNPFIDFWTDNLASVTIPLSSEFDLLSNNPPPRADVPQTFQGTLFVGGGSGSNTAPYISSPYDALVQQAMEDGTNLFHDFNSTFPSVAPSSTACLVFVNEFASEDFDRPSLADPGSDFLINWVASQCPNTIAVIHNAGIRLVSSIVDNPNVTAIIYAHLPGQDSGRALVEVLYGRQSPSGRLPYTVASQPGDYGALLYPCTASDAAAAADPQCDFSEGSNIDYRGFLARNVTPQYAFGFGLTYTTFAYGNLSISAAATASTAVAATASSVPTPCETNVRSAQAGLFEVIVEITATISNTGDYAAAEVVQLYLTLPGASTKQLRGFEKVLLQPGEQAAVTFAVRRKDVSRWDVVTQQWVVPAGRIGVEVGASVLDVRLEGGFVVAGQGG